MRAHETKRLLSPALSSARAEEREWCAARDLLLPRLLSWRYIYALMKNGMRSGLIVELVHACGDVVTG